MKQPALKQIVRKAALGAALLLSAVSGQALAETIAITGGKVMTLGKQGTLEEATILIEDGKIRDVGPNVSIPNGVKVIYAGGKVVTPGFMNSHSRLGITEISLSEDSNSHSAREEPFSAAFEVRYGLNPESVVIDANRVEGLTRAVSAPSGSGRLFSGGGMILALGDGDRVTAGPGPLFANLLDGGNHAVAWTKLRLILDQVKEYEDRRSDVMKGRWRQEYLLPLEDMDALIPVVRGERKLVLALERAADIREAIRLKKDYDLDLILMDVPEAWKVADELAEAGIPVVIDAVANLPYQFPSIGASLSNAARLEQAGVLFAISSLGETHRAYLLGQLAGNAVAHGLSYEAALKAITVNPAKIFGIADRYGTLEKGKDADIVVWDGDPLEVATNPEHVLVKGVEYPLISRRTLLRDRYMKLDRDLPPAYY
ncbi:amidohydrolase family protein [Luteithermobacter gelatinilyticus]|uniref:amidohydrolase family protein n=1 Tax=Luteithermobacter gelatinilyticus TaxID=2582913 RepID=UPI00110702DB|nr:amidohydrolase family protein [Luteithermobacter gelatinilyticus]